MRSVLTAWLLGAGLLLLGSSTFADDSAALLPVDQAFALRHEVSDNAVTLHWKIAPGYYLYRHRIRVLAANGSLQLPEGEPHQDEFFGAVQTYREPTQARWTPASGQVDARPLQIEYQGCADVGVCYPPQRRTLALDRSDPALISEVAALQATAAPQDSAEAGAMRADATATVAGAATPLWLALSLALLGGLVLNLMPCVLPVLSLKVLSLSSSGGDRAHARAQAFAYSAGVLSTFLLLGGSVLALRAFGHGAAWGVQLQQPAIVAGLAYLMVAMGLGLSGVYTPSGNLAGAGQHLTRRSGLSGDFFTGFLACIVASPCVAPFMGTALAYAFVAPTASALLVFLALGLGVALPFLLIGLVPALSKWLPQPGAWMQTLKQLLAFPLYFSAAWLLWVLGKQRGVDALALVLAGSVLLASGLWWFERSRWRGRRIASALAIGVALLALSPLAWLAQQPPRENSAARVAADQWSPQRLQQLRDAQRTVFVNVTADWCVTCKANERAVLDSAGFQQLLRERNAVSLRADWTNGDPAISRFLQQHGAVGVPLYAVYRPGRPTQLLTGLLDRSRLAQVLNDPY